MSRIGEYLRIKKHKARKEKYKPICKDAYLFKKKFKKRK